MDRFGGNQPSIITMEYVELPYMPGFKPKEMAGGMESVLEEEHEISIQNRMPWGAVIGECKNGDYLMATPSGRLTKWDGKDWKDVVGQVLASDLNAEPTGWLKWMLWEEQYKYEDNTFINRSGTSNLPTDEGYPFDPGFAEGNTIFQNYQSKLITNPTGIVGIHDGSGNYDGFGKNDTEYTKRKVGEMPTISSANTVVPFQAVDFAGGKLANLHGDVIVYISDKTDPKELTDADIVPTSRIEFVPSKGLIYVKADTTDSGKKVYATYKALHYGTPSWADFKGVHGAMYVLLKK